MPVAPRDELTRLIGREPDRLTLAERRAVAGKWMALELYSPQTLPMRRIEALGDTVEACMGQLSIRGLDPRNFEYELFRPAY